MIKDAIALHPFACAADIERLFQTELDKLPTVNNRRVVTEFGGVMISPACTSELQLTHLMFPTTMLSIEVGARTLRGYTSRNFPQVRLLVEAKSNKLYVKLASSSVTKDGLPEKRSLLLAVGEQCHFSTDIWETLSCADKEALSKHRFFPGMSISEWGEAINEYRHDLTPSQHATTINGDFLSLRELDTSVNRLGVIGTLNSYHFMPEFLASVLENNTFVYPGMEVPDLDEEIPFEIGSAHIHPTFDELSPEQVYVAERMGEDTVRRCPSVADIADMRGSQALHWAISRAYRGCGNNTLESFLGILTVNVRRQVTGSRFYDLGEIDSEDLVDVNNRAFDTLKSEAPDFDVVLEHYRMFDQIARQEFGEGCRTSHVGGASNCSKR